MRDRFATMICATWIVWSHLLVFSTAGAPGAPSCYGTKSAGEFWRKCCDYNCDIFSCSAYYTDIGCIYTNKVTSYQCAGEDTTSALTFQNKENEPDGSTYGSTPTTRVVPNTDWCTRSSDCDPFIDTATRGCCLVAVDYERHPYKNNYEAIQTRTTLGCVCQQDASWFEYSQPHSGSFGCQTTSEANQVNMPMCNCGEDSVANPFGACVVENGASRFFATCEMSEDEHCFSKYANSCLKCSMDRLTIRLYANGGAGASKWCWQEPDPLQQKNGCSGGRYDDIVRSSRDLATHVLDHDGCTWQWDECSSTSCWRYYDRNDEIPGGCSCFANGCSENIPDSSLGFCALDTCDWKDAAQCNGFDFGPPPSCQCACKEPLDGPGCTLSDTAWCSEEGTVSELYMFPTYNKEADMVFCHCAPGYAGQRCERVGCVSDADCRNEGTCTQSIKCVNNGTECWDINDRTCLCAKHFYGDRCENRVQCTRESYCNGNGECTEDAGELKCSCDYSFGGDRCEIYDYYQCDPTAGPTASTQCQGLAYCMDSENCESVEFDAVSGQYISSLRTFDTCTDWCVCAWRRTQQDCTSLSECVWDNDSCQSSICNELSQIVAKHVRQRRCETEPLCVYTDEEVCTERIFDAQDPDAHVCQVTQHGTCRDSRTQKEYSCTHNVTGGSHDTCFQTPDRFMRNNPGWTDFRFVFRGSTRSFSSDADLSIREIMLLDDQNNQIGPWFDAAGSAVNNWTVYCNTPHDQTRPESQCWRMFDRDYIADTQLTTDRFDPGANKTAPSNIYNKQYIRDCLDHYSAYTHVGCSTCKDAVACVPVMRDGSAYVFSGVPFGYGPCSLSALGRVTHRESGSGIGFRACQSFGYAYSPAYNFGCGWSSDYVWKLDKNNQFLWSDKQCSAGAFRTNELSHNEDQFSNGPVMVTLRTSDGSMVIPKHVRILCDTENIRSRHLRDCPNRVELQMRNGAGSEWVTVYDSKSDPTRMQSTHRASGMGRMLTEEDFGFVVPTQSSPFDPLQQGFVITLDIDDAKQEFVPTRTYKYDTVEVLHFDATDVLVPSTEAWTYQLWRGCIDRSIILDRRLSGSSCVSELAFEGQCSNPPCCQNKRCCAEFDFPPSTCTVWENWCRDRTTLQRQMDTLINIDDSIGNTSSQCGRATFQSQSSCVPQPMCECVLGWRKNAETGVDCAECDIVSDACVNGKCGIETNGVCTCFIGWSGPACTLCTMNAVCFGEKVCDIRTGACVAPPTDDTNYAGWYALIVFLTYANIHLLLKCLGYAQETQAYITSKRRMNTMMKDMIPKRRIS